MTGSSQWTLDNQYWVVNSGYGTRRLELLDADDLDPSIIPADRECMIEPILAGGDAVLCDNLLTTSDVPVGDFEHHFFTLP